MATYYDFGISLKDINNNTTSYINSLGDDVVYAKLAGKLCFFDTSKSYSDIITKLPSDMGNNMVTAPVGHHLGDNNHFCRIEGTYTESLSTTLNIQAKNTNDGQLSFSTSNSAQYRYVSVYFNKFQNFQFDYATIFGTGSGLYELRQSNQNGACLIQLYDIDGNKINVTRFQNITFKLYPQWKGQKKVLQYSVTYQIPYQTQVLTCSLIKTFEEFDISNFWAINAQSGAAGWEVRYIYI